MTNLHRSDVLRRPLITEKNTTLTPLGQYTFEVAINANKIQIKEAVEEIFNVKVKAVNTMIIKGKKRRVMRSRARTLWGSTNDMKKAVVTLEPGYDINIFGDI